jgi:hypothetical protein
MFKSSINLRVKGRNITFKSKNSIHARFEVLTAMLLKIQVFHDVIYPLDPNEGDALIFGVQSPKGDHSNNRGVLINCSLFKSEVDRKRWKERKRKGQGEVR